LISDRGEAGKGQASGAVEPTGDPAIQGLSWLDGIVLPEGIWVKAKGFGAGRTAGTTCAALLADRLAIGGISELSPANHERL
jgi:hypothetical protein